MYNTNTIPKLTKFRPIFQIFEINNSKTKTKLETLKASALSVATWTSGHL